MKMAQHEGMHPSVEQFKHFVKEHPKISMEIRSNQKSLQQFYEEWSVLGADHEQWIPYKTMNQQAETFQQASQQMNQQTTAQPNSDSTQQSEQQNATDTLGQLMNMMRRFNVQDLQNHLAQFSSVLSNVQNVMQTFQQPTNSQSRPTQDQPFSFRRD